MNPIGVLSNPNTPLFDGLCFFGARSTPIPLCTSLLPAIDNQYDK